MGTGMLSGMRAVLRAAAPLRTVVAVLLVSLTIAPAGAAEADGYRVAPRPSWVVDVPSREDAGAPEGQLSNGAWYLLSDTQVRLSDGMRETYRAFAIKAVNGNGVDAAASIQISYDPSYQSLTLHGIDVIRAGRRTARLVDTKIQILRRETGLEYRVYDGSNTLNAILDDVRVGDVVEYAYTIVGSNPVFGGREFGTFQLRFSEPAQRLHARLLVPAGRSVAITPRNDPPAAAITEHDGFIDHRWSVSDVAALVVEDGAPRWYDPYPVVQWSEFPDWAAVVRWAEPLYRLPSNLPPELRAQIAAIAQDEDRGSRMLGALRFVQEEIRYLGVEIGPGSHAPNPPALVYQRRFGDCKDKALLLLSMLRELDIEARPALVNTHAGPDLPARQASPGAFDHVLVEAAIDGRRYWIDPTRAPQKGDLVHLVQPDYGHALPVDLQSRELIAMENASGALDRKRVRAVFDAREGLDRPVGYSITTIAEGSAAEALRDSLVSSNSDQLQQQYVNYYARYYPNIAVAEPLSVVGDDEANRLTVDERYRITDFGVWSAAALRYEAPVEAPDMAELLMDPSPAIRRAPLARRYPYEFEQVTEVLLPESWPYTPGTSKIDDPAFSFERTISGEASRIILTDRYVAKVPVIEAADMPRYLANLGRARTEMAYHLQWAKPGSTATGFDAPNWPLVVMAILLLACWTGLAMLAYRWDPAPAGRHVDPRLTGFGGWLLLPAFGILVSPIRIAVDVVGARHLFTTGVWTNLAVPGGTGYDPLWAPAIMLTIGANLALLVFSILLIVLLVQRRRSLPWAYTLFVLGNLAIQAADHWFSAKVTPETPLPHGSMAGMIGTLWGSVIWIGYFHMSKRVHSTFVRARSRTTASEPAGSGQALANPA